MSESASRHRIILASRSPRRYDILRKQGLSPTIMLPQVDEGAIELELGHGFPGPPAVPTASDVAALVEELAARKARDVYERLLTGDAFCLHCHTLVGLPDMIANSTVLGADTLVYQEGLGILGKPADHDEACAMLEALRDSTHQVLTGVALIPAATGEPTSFVDVATVRFGDYTREDIEAFIAAEPPYDKAGAYGAQGLWATHIAHIEGDPNTVIGLPWQRLQPLFTACGAL